MKGGKIMSEEEKIEKETIKVTEQIAKMEKYINNINFSKFISKCQEAFSSVKKNIEKLINSNTGTNIAIAINTQELQKQIGQIEKQIDSLQQKIEGRYSKNLEF